MVCISEKRPPHSLLTPRVGCRTAAMAGAESLWERQLPAPHQTS